MVVGPWGSAVTVTDRVVWARNGDE
jgi:hypothetical protein